ncbi:DUF3168 domain-containing protein [Sulfitobacter sp. PS-8MA]|uniref:DUF3168 domain-containing protein n=1 Tax=Sulfitobacter sp. PS-8MA TaxID=3237707 RepID=UPI0034C68322
MADGYSLALQGAIVTALKADPAVTALVGPRVYGLRVPDSAERPYIFISSIEVRDVRSDCADAGSVTFGIVGTSRSVTNADVESARCAEAAHEVLKREDIMVNGYTLVQLQRAGESRGLAGDGKSFEAATAYTALLDG